jgi:hypothetical protein
MVEADRLEDALRGAGGIGGSRVKDVDVARWREELIVLTLAKGSPADASRLLTRFFARSKEPNQLANRKADLRRKGFAT